MSSLENILNLPLRTFIEKTFAEKQLGTSALRTRLLNLISTYQPKSTVKEFLEKMSVRNLLRYRNFGRKTAELLQQVFFQHGLEIKN